MWRMSLWLRAFETRGLQAIKHRNTMRPSSILVSWRLITYVIMYPGSLCIMIRLCMLTFLFLISLCSSRRLRHRNVLKFSLRCEQGVSRVPGVPQKLHLSWDVPTFSSFCQLLDTWELVPTEFKKTSLMNLLEDLQTYWLEKRRKHDLHTATCEELLEATEEVKALQAQVREDVEGWPRMMEEQWSEVKFRFSHVFVLL